MMSQKVKKEKIDNKENTKKNKEKERSGNFKTKNFEK